MIIAKEFHWEMGHRLPFHQGKCKNLHGHSYILRLSIEGEPDTNGMLIDFYDLKQFIAPIIEELDHAYVACKTDIELIEALKKLGTKMVVLPYHSTVENLCKYFLERLAQQPFPANISGFGVTIWETRDSYASDSAMIQQAGKES